MGRNKSATSSTKGQDGTSRDLAITFIDFFCYLSNHCKYKLLALTSLFGSKKNPLQATPAVKVLPKHEIQV
jgi:hypothetical protein